MSKLKIIQSIKEHLQIKTDTEFAKFLGITQPTLSNWKARGNMDYELIVNKIPEINANWLITGKGEMINYQEIVNKQDISIYKVDEFANIIEEPHFDYSKIFLKTNLRHLRNSRNLTIQEVSNLLGFKRTQWGNWELGVSNPRIEDLVSIAKLFGISETAILHYDLSKYNLENVKKLIGSAYKSINDESNLIINENLTLKEEALKDKQKIIDMLEKKISIIEKLLNKNSNNDGDN